MRVGQTAHRFKDPLNLTPTEAKIWGMRESGATAEDIAKDLRIAERTVREAIKKCREKVILKELYDAQDRRISWP
jgi:DNA-binding CsgD family transcriptional regulator